jgi:CRISPR/Cas system CMR subunit Cmr4 (Cas7 group RAMP superfamily)
MNEEEYVPENTIFYCFGCMSSVGTCRALMAETVSRVVPAQWKRQWSSNLP